MRPASMQLSSVVWWLCAELQHVRIDSEGSPFRLTDSLFRGTDNGSDISRRGASYGPEMMVTRPCRTVTLAIVASSRALAAQSSTVTCPLIARSNDSDFYTDIAVLKGRRVAPCVGIMHVSKLVFAVYRFNCLQHAISSHLQRATKGVYSTHLAFCNGCLPALHLAMSSMIGFQLLDCGVSEHAPYSLALCPRGVLLDQGKAARVE